MNINKSTIITGRYPEMINQILSLLMVLVLVSISTVYSQPKKGNSTKSTQKQTTKEITFEERTNLYMPVNEPRPCSVYLLDFGTDKQSVFDEAKRIGLVYDTTYNVSGYTICCFEEPKYDTRYQYWMDSTDRYMGFVYKTRKTEVAFAVQTFEKYVNDIWMYWNGEKDETSATAECIYSGKKYRIRVTRDRDNVDLTILLMTR
jgi:hypothetical protein